MGGGQVQLTGGSGPADGGGGQVQLRGGSGPASGGGSGPASGGGSASCALLRAVCLLHSRRRTFLFSMFLLQNHCAVADENPHIQWL